MRKATILFLILIAGGIFVFSFLAKPNSEKKYKSVQIEMSEEEVIETIFKEELYQ
ncbi:MAG: hypothetical protein ACJAV6_000151 [Candidatus Paceibacteria bacterium]|jgi:hypothetical protein